MPDPKKYQISFVAKNFLGIHARASAVIVQHLEKYSSEILFTNNNGTVNGKSILSLMMLSGDYGDEFQIEVQGEDSERVIITFNKLVDIGFYELENWADDLYRTWQVEEARQRELFLSLQAKFKTRKGKLNFNKYLLGILENSDSIPAFLEFRKAKVMGFQNNPIFLSRILQKFPILNSNFEITTMHHPYRDEILWACLYLINRFDYFSNVKEFIEESYFKHKLSDYLYAVVFELLYHKEPTTLRLLIEIVENNLKNKLAFGAISKLYSCSKEVREYLLDACYSWDSERFSNLALFAHYILKHRNRNSDWLERFLNDKNPKVRYFFANSLFYLYKDFPQETFNHLLFLAKDKDEIVRWQVCSILNKLKNRGITFNVNPFAFLRNDSSKLVYMEFNQLTTNSL